MKTRNSGKAAATATSNTPNHSMQAAKEQGQGQDGSLFEQHTNPLTSNYGKNYSPGIALVRQDFPEVAANLTSYSMELLNVDLTRATFALNWLQQEVERENLSSVSERNDNEKYVMMITLTKVISVLKDSVEAGVPPKILAGAVGLGDTPYQNKQTRKLEIEYDERGRQIVNPKNPYANSAKEVEEAIRIGTDGSVAVAGLNIISHVSQSELSGEQKQRMYINKPSRATISAFAKAIVNVTRLFPLLPFHFFFLTKIDGVRVVNDVVSFLESPTPVPKKEPTPLDFLLASEGKILSLIALVSHPRVLVETKPRNNNIEEGIIAQEFAFFDGLIAKLGLFPKWTLMGRLIVNDNLPMISIGSVQNGLLQTVHANEEVDMEKSKIASEEYNSFDDNCAKVIEKQQEFVRNKVRDGQELEPFPEASTVAMIAFNAQYRKLTSGAERRRQRAPQASILKAPPRANAQDDETAALVEDEQVNQGSNDKKRDFRKDPRHAPSPPSAAEASKENVSWANAQSTFQRSESQNMLQAERERENVRLHKQKSPNKKKEKFNPLSLERASVLQAERENAHLRQQKSRNKKKENFNLQQEEQASVLQAERENARLRQQKKKVKSLLLSQEEQARVVQAERENARLRKQKSRNNKKKEAS